MQFHLLPIRDWNGYLSTFRGGVEQLQFHLLPIRDWNKEVGTFDPKTGELQFHLLPIRDWNYCGCFRILSCVCYCNFIYSLLGIETTSSNVGVMRWSNCNFIYSLLGIETLFMMLFLVITRIAISFTPY